VGLPNIGNFGLMDYGAQHKIQQSNNDPPYNKNQEMVKIIKRKRDIK
jgi:hypothetical protein